VFRPSTNIHPWLSTPTRKILIHPTRCATLVIDRSLIGGHHRGIRDSKVRRPAVPTRRWSRHCTRSAGKPVRKRWAVDLEVHCSLGFSPSIATFQPHCRCLLTMPRHYDFRTIKSTTNPQIQSLQSGLVAVTSLSVNIKVHEGRQGHLACTCLPRGVACG